MADWFTCNTPEAAGRTKAAWADAPIENEELCGMLLEVAREQVIQFAPEGEPEEQVTFLLECLGYPAETVAAVLEVLEVEEVPPVPTRYVLAQIRQAANLWIAGQVQNDDGTAGGGGFTYTPRPLDKTIQKIIRPASGVADV